MNKKLVDVPHCCWQIFHPVQAVEGEDLGKKMYSMIFPTLVVIQTRSIDH